MPYRALGAPVGSLLDFAGLSVPAGWLECLGQAVSRATYARLLAALTTVLNGTLTVDSLVVTGLASTADLFPGMYVEGEGIHVPGWITSVDSDTQVTLSHTPTVSGVKSLTFFPHGNGNSSTTFNVPDLSQRVVIGRKTTDETMKAAGQKVGAETAVLAEDQLPAHAHSQDVRSTVLTSSGSSPTGDMASGAVYESMSQGSSTGSIGSGAAVSLMQPSLVVRKIIKT
jgi:microcystin-dependent protein